MFVVIYVLRRSYAYAFSSSFVRDQHPKETRETPRI